MELTGSKEKNRSSKRSLLVITCECGYEILVLPDLRVMNIAIEKHVLEHKNIGITKSSAKRIEDALIAQLFNKLAESEK